MSELIGSVVAIFGAVLIHMFVVRSILSLTVGLGSSVLPQASREDGKAAGSLFPFLIMLLVLLIWAGMCFKTADWLAGEAFANRWVLLFLAGALSGGPYFLFQRQVANIGIAARLSPPLQSALEYAGGIQSKVVFFGMLSGAYFDWWRHLPG